MKQVYFENIQDIIRNQIMSAHSKVYVAVAWFTNRILFDELNNALQRNINVKVLIHDDILNRNEFGLDFGNLVTMGAEVRFSGHNERTMHNKFCVIDDKVITGSYNWTYQANYNDENVIVINDSEISHNYVEKFENLFNAGKTIKIPYEHLKWTDIKEGDFTELRRNIYRDVIAQNDENMELKREKLICLSKAYKYGCNEEIAVASSIPIKEKYITVADILTSCFVDYEYKLWNENPFGQPVVKTVGYTDFKKWIFLPYELAVDKNHREYVEGRLKPYSSKSNQSVPGLDLKIYNELFILTIKRFIRKDRPLYLMYNDIPENLLCIENAKMFFYQFPSQMYNISQPKLSENGMPRLRGGINLFGIAKEIRNNAIDFYEGWDPEKRGKMIMKKFFVKEL